MKVGLLRRVKLHILEEPRRLDMTLWKSIRWGEDPPPCGTTACIGGWALILSQYQGKGPVDRDAAKALHLTKKQAVRLFYVSFWPPEFKDAYLRAKPKKRAAIAAARIDHFIKTGK